MKAEDRIPDASSEYIRVVKVKGVNGEEKTLKFPMKLDLERPKRPRTTFNEEQLKALEEMFQMSSYLTGEARAALASKLGLTDTQVKVWLQNRRTKSRRAKEPKSENNHSDSPLASCQSAISLQTSTIPASMIMPMPQMIPYLQPSCPVNFLVSPRDSHYFNNFSNSMFATK
ncbi:hypothetical protein WR25_11884 [Diploscapter pachys]|uniref:Homeobox domain-containing protein n=1 Tax=Diploscapter pachys TaxID=2018661 RepID=A0A2A2JAK2_9BILA|nr:hypothetical protein WR25_11884 [Diploscapter pachys]